MCENQCRIEIRDARLFVDGSSLDTEYPVSNAFCDGSKLIVLFDPDSKINKFGQFANLIAVDILGRTIWTAELPTTETGDAYYRIVSQNPLVAYSVCSFSCEIDLDTGKIKHKSFYK